ncbi:MAG: GDP-mannose 4,6-dehydratase [candidate division NC10 bacterium]|nr:GDP-mannose 4,6-dehydratase [candidate division NC10 bacterium]
MRRAFVTGIAGFAGSHLAERLLAGGAEVWGLVVKAGETANLATCRSGPAAARIHLVPGDLCDGPALAGILREACPDEIYHLAAASSVRQSLERPAETFRVNVLGTRALLEAVRETGGHPRILFVGSAEAYGESAAAPSPLREEDPLLPVSPYGSSKAAGEILAGRYVREFGLDIVRVRPFPHTGPRHAPVFVYPDLARQLVEIETGRRPARLEVGNLGIRRDLSDVREMMEGYVLALARGETGAVYNLCSGRVVSLRDVLDIMMALVGIRVEIASTPDRLRPHDLPVLAGSNRAFHQRTGWQPTRPLESTLRDLLDSCRARREENTARQGKADKRRPIRLWRNQ